MKLIAISDIYFLENELFFSIPDKKQNSNWKTKRGDKWREIK